MVNSQVDCMKFIANLVLYAIIWVITYSRGKETFDKHKKFTLILVVLFYVINLGISGFLYPDFKEMWMLAVSWPLIVSYLMLEFTKKEREKEIEEKAKEKLEDRVYREVRNTVIEDLIVFLQKRRDQFQDIISSKHTERFEKKYAKRMIPCVEYLIKDIEAITSLRP